ncbi:hypothetical protein NEHOM01_0811 [Nematocida homosporus]|uniref:uncharacterized protein n=1 Tax=Nematocida homosporus TaxID=1912981 RepID=UPI0022212A80|nr:uncharacterized protein NEHOM01_0811 [Nematocida homosporus]KAI5185396.1 hypothetical protein NEHOM01_0811 [Nematocida homosporus]
MANDIFNLFLIEPTPTKQENWTPTIFCITVVVQVFAIIYSLAFLYWSDPANLVSANNPYLTGIWNTLLAMVLGMGIAIAIFFHKNWTSEDSEADKTDKKSIVALITISIIMAIAIALAFFQLTTLFPVLEGKPTNYCTVLGVCGLLSSLPYGISWIYKQLSPSHSPSNSTSKTPSESKSKHKSKKDYTNVQYIAFGILAAIAISMIAIAFVHYVTLITSTPLNQGTPNLPSNGAQ